MADELRKTTLRIPKKLLGDAKQKAFDHDIPFYQMVNSLLGIWVKRVPGKAHVEFRPNGEIQMMTPEEIEADLEDLRKKRKKRKKP